MTIYRPSRLWKLKGWSGNRPAPKEKLPWDCCEVRRAIRGRDQPILDVITKSVNVKEHENFPIFAAIKSAHDDCASTIISFFPKMIYCKNKGGEPPLCFAVRNEF